MIFIKKCIVKINVINNDIQRINLYNKAKYYLMCQNINF